MASTNFNLVTIKVGIIITKLTKEIVMKLINNITPKFQPIGT